MRALITSVALVAALLLGTPLLPRAVAQDAAPPAEPDAPRHEKAKKGQENGEKRNQNVPPGEPKPPKVKPKPKPKSEAQDNPATHEDR